MVGSCVHRVNPVSSSLQPMQPQPLTRPSHQDFFPRLAGIENGLHLALRIMHHRRTDVSPSPTTYLSQSPPLQAPYPSAFTQSARLPVATDEPLSLYLDAKGVCYPGLSLDNRLSTTSLFVFLYQGYCSPAFLHCQEMGCTGRHQPASHEV